MENKKETSTILTYSAIEQSKNNIMGPGRYLITFLGIFPFIPLFLSLFSCFIQKISYDLYRILLFLAAIVLIIIMAASIILWVFNMMRVYIIDEKGELYRLRASTFWYKIKDKMYLINPTGSTGGRLMRVFYMINNIKVVLMATAEDVTYEDFIAMGKMEKLSEISNVVVNKKSVRLTAKVESKKGTERKNIYIKRVFEKDEKFCEYLKILGDTGSYIEAKECFNIKNNKENESIKNNIKNNASNLKRFIRFTIKWTCVMAWIAVFTVSSDLSRLSKINAGEYVQSVDDKNREIYVSVKDEDKYFLKSDYGKTYKPVLVIYFSVEIIYAIMKITDEVILKAKKEQNV